MGESPSPRPPPRERACSQASIVDILPAPRVHASVNFFKSSHWSEQSQYGRLNSHVSKRLFFRLVVPLSLVGTFSFPFAPKSFSFAVQSFLEFVELSSINNAHWIVLLPQVSLEGSLYHSKRFWPIFAAISLPNFRIKSCQEAIV